MNGNSDSGNNSNSNSNSNSSDSSNDNYCTSRGMGANLLPSDFRPMLSASIRNDADFKKLRNWPYIVSPKLDGIRIFIDPKQGAVTRTMKPIRNMFLYRQFINLLKNVPEFAGCDGEIIFGPPQNACLISPTVFQDTTSAVMSYNGSPEVTFWMFDIFLMNKSAEPYLERLDYLQRKVLRKIHQLEGDKAPSINMRVLESVKVHNLEDLLLWEQRYVEMGFEGLMIRNPERIYRFGRSSLHDQQQHLIKLKRMQDAEGIIVGFEELMHNENPNEFDEFGLTKRTSRKEGLQPANTLGALHIRIINGDFKDRILAIGSGFDAATRQHIWDNRQTHIGKKVTFKYQAQGAKDLPRFPIFKGFREDF